MLLALLILLIVRFTASCGSQHRGEPNGPRVVPDTVAEARGARLFSRNCYQCHPGGGSGLGPALNNKPLPEVAIRTQIREGVGAMPAFDGDMLTDDEVAAIAKYVQELRGTPATGPTRSAHASR
jgi:mono/diheme cytochrome c family protein